MASTQINITPQGLKKFFKIIGFIILIILGIAFWYIAIPAVVVWYLYRKNKTFSPKVKLISSIAVAVVFFSMGGVNAYSNREPVLTISEPQNGISAQSERITVKGTVSPSKAIITIDGIPTEVDSKGNFSYDARLRNENNNLKIEAKNGSKVVMETVNVNRIFTEEELAEIENQKEVARQAKIDEVKTYLQREIDSLNKPFDNSPYRKNVDGLIMETVLFGAWAKSINEHKNNPDPTVKSLVSELERKVSQLQVREFPLMRKAYVELVGKELWVQNIEVKALGAGNKTIEFTAGMFANNQNIATVHGTAKDTLKHLRFTRANYKWYKYDDEYTYFTIESDSDAKILEL